MKLKKNYGMKGFTLIELLIVIAVLGVLAAVVLVIINPVEQLARGRDAGRKSTVAQLGTAIQTFYTSNSAYPAVGTWNADLTTSSGELKSFPTAPTGAVNCGVNPQPSAAGFCYNTAIVSGAAEAIVFVHLESKSETSKCGNVAANTWYGWSSADGKAGTICGAAAPVPGPQTFVP